MNPSLSTHGLGVGTVERKGLMWTNIATWTYFPPRDPNIALFG